jgi:hypothetical protein
MKVSVVPNTAIGRFDNSLFNFDALQITDGSERRLCELNRRCAIYIFP